MSIRMAYRIAIALSAASLAGCALPSPPPWAAQDERIELPSLRDIAAARRSGPHTLLLPPGLKTPEQQAAATQPPPKRSVIAEIDGASRLASAWDRRQVYRQLAAERGVDDASQCHLVNAALDHLISETAKEEVLLVLMTNPDFSPAAEELILRRLTNFTSPARRQRLLAAMPRFRGIDRSELDLLGWLWDRLR